MEVKRCRTVALEIFKTNNVRSLSLMKELINMRIGTNTRKNNLTSPARETVTYVDKSIKTLEPLTWNTLPEKVKGNTRLQTFRNLIKTWFAPSFKHRQKHHFSQEHPKIHMDLQNLVLIRCKVVYIIFV